MRVPFQAIHVSWAHALPIYSDVPDLHILRTFFSNSRTVVYPVRMETCCRASVAFLDCQSRLSPDPPLYSDTLALACRSGLYIAAPLGIFPNRQTWLNHTDTPYYPCPYSTIPYRQLVEYYIEEPYQSPTTTCQQIPQNQQQQSGNINQVQNRPKRAGGTNGGFKRPQHPGQSSSRRFRKNSQRNGGNQHPPSKKTPAHKG